MGILRRMGWSVGIALVIGWVFWWLGPLASVARFSVHPWPMAFWKRVGPGVVHFYWTSFALDILVWAAIIFVLLYFAKVFKDVLISP